MNPVRLLSLRQVENSGPRDDRRRGTPDLLIEHFSRMPPADVPDPSTWHHAWCRPVGEARVGSEEDVPVSSEEGKNKVLVRRFWEAQANADLDTLDELLAPDFVDRSLLPGQEPSREGYKQQVAEQIAALSDVRCIIEDQLDRGDGYGYAPHRGRQDRRGVERGERWCPGGSGGASRARGAQARARRGGP